VHTRATKVITINRHFFENSPLKNAVAAVNGTCQHQASTATCCNNLANNIGFFDKIDCP
jgi:hypothetical protein